MTLHDTAEELLKTNLFHRIIQRNGKQFAEDFAKWLIQYILVAASMHEALDLDLGLILYTLHGENLQKITKATAVCIDKKSKQDLKK